MFTKSYRLLRVVLIVFTSASILGGCAVVPKVSERQVPEHKCELVTKKLELKMKVMSNSCIGRPNDIFSCLVASGLIVVPVSTVISGSIVLVGNTLHWAEKSLSCADKNPQKTDLGNKVQSAQLQS